MPRSPDVDVAGGDELLIERNDGGCWRSVRRRGVQVADEDQWPVQRGRIGGGEGGEQLGRLQLA